MCGLTITIEMTDNQNDVVLNMIVQIMLFHKNPTIPTWENNDNKHLFDPFDQITNDYILTE